jgi:hypothetical protein
MSINTLVSEIDHEIAGLTQARKILTSLNGHSTRPAAGTHKRRPLSVAARKRIAAAQKKRWAEQRKAAKKTA